jgi:hypothetical protein
MRTVPLAPTEGVAAASGSGMPASVSVAGGPLVGRRDIFCLVGVVVVVGPTHETRSLTRRDPHPTLLTPHSTPRWDSLWLVLATAVLVLVLVVVLVLATAVVVVRARWARRARSGAHQTLAHHPPWACRHQPYTCHHRSRARARVARAHKCRHQRCTCRHRSRARAHHPP